MDTNENLEKAVEHLVQTIQQAHIDETKMVQYLEIKAGSRETWTNDVHHDAKLIFHFI